MGVTGRGLSHKEVSLPLKVQLYTPHKVDQNRSVQSRRKEEQELASWA